MRPPGLLLLVTLIGFFRTIDQSQADLIDTLDEYWAADATVTLVKARDPWDIVLCTIKKQECRKPNVAKNVVCDIQNGYGDNDWTNTPEQQQQEDLNATCLEEAFGNISLSHFRCLVAKILNYTAKGCGDYGTVCDIYSGLSPTSTSPERPTSATAPHTRSPLGAPGMATAETEDLLRSSLAVSLSLNVVLPLAVYLVMCCQRRRRRRRAQASEEPFCPHQTHFTADDKTGRCLRIPTYAAAP